MKSEEIVQLALPKGRMQEGVLTLLGEAGVRVRMSDRAYRPTISMAGVEAKMLKPQNIVEMLHAGSRDVGFAGADWVAELDGELVELLDTGLDPVRVVAAAPRELLDRGWPPLGGKRLRVASEYERLTRAWIARNNLEADFIRSYGATEVFPPQDADCIVDNSASGSTLAANGLEEIDQLMRSSTRLYANPRALENPVKRQGIENLALLLSSALEARRRVMVEVNVSADRLEAVIAALPCMRRPTIARLHGEEDAYAVRVAAPRDQLAQLIPAIKARGATDVVVMNIAQLSP